MAGSHSWQIAGPGSEPKVFDPSKVSDTKVRSVLPLTVWVKGACLLLPIPQLFTQ